MIPTTRLLARFDQLATSSALALIDPHGQATFASVAERARQLAAELVRRGLSGRRIALLAPPDRDWVEGFWAILLAHATPVPLSQLHPTTEQEAFLVQSGAAALLLAPSAAPGTRARHPTRLVFTGGRILDSAQGPSPAAAIREHADPEAATALLLYTSGTTGRPKGVPLSHRNVMAGIETLVSAWGMSPVDRLVHCLPLHHLHGICVSLLCAFCAGASTRLLPGYSPAAVLEAVSGASVLMGVPTQHKRLVDHLDALGEAERVRCTRDLHALRLITSGSAKLPETLGERMRVHSGQYPLERYGMTEVGIVLSNPLAGARQPGSCGAPLPGCEIRVVDEAGHDVARGSSGELWIRAASVFAGYDGDPESTARAFSDGFFKSGDTVRWTSEGFIQVLGRTSVDIIKSGGYKLSAIEIEEHLRGHPWVHDVAVVGVADDDWGERAVAVVVPSAAAPRLLSSSAAGDERSAASRELQQWMKDRVAGYQIPKSFVWAKGLPRNALGKVQKTVLIEQLSSGAPA